jgi:L-aminopeptidase/D-esterase-like protein
MTPRLPRVHSRLEVEGFSLGHASDRTGMTGVTVILCPQGAVAVADVRGSATGTRQFDSLVTPHHVATRAHGLVFAGGSGFGLAAADAVVATLKAAGSGFQTPFGPVPLVPTAILFDLAFGDRNAVPTWELSHRAAASARAGPVACGSVGAGTGATVGKALGPECAMKGGFGFAAVSLPSGLRVAAAAAVNAFGDVRDPQTGRLVAGCRRRPASMRLADAERVLAHLPQGAAHPWQGNTTLVAVLTNARLPREALRKVCEMAFGGLYRALQPAVSIVDGDLLVTLASGKVEAHPHQVGVLAQNLAGAAILRAVEAADGFGILPAVRDLAKT